MEILNIWSLNFTDLIGHPLLISENVIFNFDKIRGE